MAQDLGTSEQHLGAPEEDPAGSEGEAPLAHQIGDLAEVLSNLGVFRMHPEEMLALCPSGFRRVSINQGRDHYLSLQGFSAGQPAFAHTHRDSEEWIVVLRGTGRALLDETPVPLEPGLVVGRAAAHPHGFESGNGPLHLLSLQVPRPAEGVTTWDQPGTTTDPRDCAVAGTCRRCARCGGHSANVRARTFLCENCGLEF